MQKPFQNNLQLCKYSYVSINTHPNKAKTCILLLTYHTIEMQVNFTPSLKGAGSPRDKFPVGFMLGWLYSKFDKHQDFYVFINVNIG